MVVFVRVQRCLAHVGKSSLSNWQPWSDVSPSGIPNQEKLGFLRWYLKFGSANGTVSNQQDTRLMVRRYLCPRESGNGPTMSMYLKHCDGTWNLVKWERVWRCTLDFWLIKQVLAVWKPLFMLGHIISDISFFMALDARMGEMNCWKPSDDIYFFVKQGCWLICHKRFSL